MVDVDCVSCRANSKNATTRKSRSHVDWHLVPASEQHLKLLNSAVLGNIVFRAAAEHARVAAITESASAGGNIRAGTRTIARDCNSTDPLLRCCVIFRGNCSRLLSLCIHWRRCCVRTFCAHLFHLLGSLDGLVAQVSGSRLVPICWFWVVLHLPPATKAEGSVVPSNERPSSLLMRCAMTSLECAAYVGVLQRGFFIVCHRFTHSMPHPTEATGTWAA